MNQTTEQLFRQFITAFESGDLETLKSIVAPDIVDHTPPPGAPPGIDGVLGAVTAYRDGFPDLSISIDKMVCDGDSVVGYGRIRGTHSGNFFGTPATGHSVDFGYLDMYQVHSGRITDAWHIEDIAGLMRQITPTDNHAAVAG
jgi:predicted ester cyclase